MAIALYRRYRPETFAEMIGQSQVTEPLMTALRNGKVGHAYLFSGPRGCGKTTSARVLARCLNCAEGPTDTPCGTCPSCVELSRDGGGSLDVIEIDAASHGGVDDARDLRERAIFAPVRDRYKIFIIDEAHMVTKEGFNALLKIVEEPPEHVKFVFATTEPEKVIGTIRSRTHHYPFRLIAPAALLNYVEQLSSEEGIAAEDGVLPLVIRAGAGSARDTLSILDQLIAGSESGNISYERAVGLLGYTPDDLLDEVVEAFGAADAAAGVRAVDRVIQTGQDPRRFVEDLLERLRDLIIVQATDIDGATSVLRGLPEEQLRRFVDQSSGFARGAISRIADVVSDALDQMTGATAPKLHLELMIARIFVTLQQQVGVGAAPAVQTNEPHVAKRQVSQPVVSQPAATPSTAAQPPAAQSQPPAATPPRAVAAPEVPPAPAARPAQAPVRPADAIRNARAFLAGEPPAAVPAQQAPAPAAVPRPVTWSTEGVQSVWAEVAQQIGRATPEALATIGRTVVIGVDTQTLHLGFIDNAHLESFKQLCAGPIRNDFQSRFNITVGYQPWVGEDRVGEGRQLFGASAPAATPTHTPAAEHTAVAPHSPTTNVQSEPEPPYDDEPPFEDPGYGRAPDPAVPTREPAPDREPAPGPDPMPHPVPETPFPEEPERAPAPEPAPQPMPEPGPAPYPVPEPEPIPQPVRQQTAPQPATETSLSEMPEPQEPPQSSAPTFTRYGESVVREVLGAKFVGEQPL